MSDARSEGVLYASKGPGVYTTQTDHVAVDPVLDAVDGVWVVVRVLARILTVLVVELK